MEKNFTIAKGCEIIQGGEFWDLHNCYNFYLASIYPSGLMQVIFKPSSGYGRGKKPVVFDFHKADYLAVSPNVAALPENFLDEIGYKEYDDFNHDYLSEERHFVPSSHVFFRLYDDEYIRVHAERAEFYEVESLEGIGPILKPNGG